MCAMHTYTHSHHYTKRTLGVQLYGGSLPCDILIGCLVHTYTFYLRSYVYILRALKLSFHFFLCLPLYLFTSFSSLYTLHTSRVSSICSSFSFPLFVCDLLSLLSTNFGASITPIFLILASLSLSSAVPFPLLVVCSHVPSSLSMSHNHTTWWTSPLHYILSLL